MTNRDVLTYSTYYFKKLSELTDHAAEQPDANKHTRALYTSMLTTIVYLTLISEDPNIDNTINDVRRFFETAKDTFAAEAKAKACSGGGSNECN